MLSNDGNGVTTSPSVYPLFNSWFSFVDAASAFWQPALKAVGRTQLDLATLRARQTRTMLNWGAEIMRPQSPMELFAANVRLWQTLTEQSVEAVPYVISAAGVVAPLEATIHELPERKSRDTLILLDRPETLDDETEYERRVA